MTENKNENIIISYIALRRLIGILGLLLPIICILGGYLFSNLPIQKSISFYYHTNMRDFFVGLLVGISMFLISYKGYERIDNIITTMSGVAGFGIAFFPCLYNSKFLQPVGVFQVNPIVSNSIHLLCASTFFLLLAVNSIFLFTLSKKGDDLKTKNKNIRNNIYKWCGIVILLSLVFLLISILLINPIELDRYRIVFIFETIMLFSFSISWLVKGGTMFKDKQETSQEMSRIKVTNVGIRVN